MILFVSFGCSLLVVSVLPCVSVAEISIISGLNLSVFICVYLWLITAFCFGIASSHETGNQWRQNVSTRVTLEMLWTRLISIVDEAAAAIVRTSFSTVVRESNDFAWC